MPVEFDDFDAETPLDSADLNAKLNALKDGGNIALQLRPYSTLTEYDAYDVVREDGKVYLSIQAANTNNAVTDTAWWVPIGAGGLTEDDFVIENGDGSSRTTLTGGIMELRKTADGASLGGGLIVSHANGTPGSETAIEEDDRLGIVGGAGYDADADLDAILPVGAAVVFKANEDWDDTSHGSRMDFEACAAGETTRQIVGRLAPMVTLASVSNATAVDAGKSGDFFLPLDENSELQNPTGAHHNQTLLFKIRPTGGDFALTLDTKFSLSEELKAVDPDFENIMLQTEDSTTWLLCVYDADDDIFFVMDVATFA